MLNCTQHTHESFTTIPNRILEIKIGSFSPSTTHLTDAQQHMNGAGYEFSIKIWCYIITGFRAHRALENGFAFPFVAGAYICKFPPGTQWKRFSVKKGFTVQMTSNKHMQRHKQGSPGRCICVNFERAFEMSGGDVVVEPSMGCNSVNVKAQNVHLKEPTMMLKPSSFAVNVLKTYFIMQRKFWSFKVRAPQNIWQKREMAIIHETIALAKTPRSFIHLRKKMRLPAKCLLN